MPNALPMEEQIKKQKPLSGQNCPCKRKHIKMTLAKAMKNQKYLRSLAHLLVK